MGEHQTFESVLAEVKSKRSKPPMACVMIFDDDYTPMEFVVAQLVAIFELTYKDAANVTLQVHYEGKASCGEFPVPVAHDKVQQLEEISKKHGYPLLCEVQKMS